MQRIHINVDGVRLSHVSPKFLVKCVLITILPFTQIIRYAKNGSPLWCSSTFQPQAKDIPTCQCGSPRLFEFQVIIFMRYLTVKDEENKYYAVFMACIVITYGFQTLCSQIARKHLLRRIIFVAILFFGYLFISHIQCEAFATLKVTTILIFCKKSNDDTRWRFSILFKRKILIFQQNFALNSSISPSRLRIVGEYIRFEGVMLWN